MHALHACLTHEFVCGPAPLHQPINNVAECLSGAVVPQHVVGGQSESPANVTLSDIMSLELV